MKRVAVINDLSGFGRCSLTAAIAVLSAMQVSPCPLPTAVLSAQSEFERCHMVDLTAEMPEFIRMWRLNGESFDAILTGYAPNAAQLETVLGFASVFGGTRVPLIVDPVMGDNGRLYPGYGHDACLKMKELAAAADIITPNLTELCLLTGADYDALSQGESEEAIAELCRSFMKSGAQAVVTGIRRENGIGNLVVSGDKTVSVTAQRFDESFSGTGDLFAAVLCGAVLNDKSVEEGARLAADFICRAAADTVKEPHDPLYGVDFEKHLHVLWRSINANG